jgi:hypothetical protein
LNIGKTGETNFNPDIVTLDGYVFVRSNSGTDSAAGRIYNSTIGAPTTFSTSTDFIEAEQFADPLTKIAVYKNHLVAFGGNSTEFFYNAANSIGSPLSRQSAYAFEMGAPANEYGQSVISFGDTLYFIGQRNGIYQGVFKLENFRPVKVSPTWLDEHCAKGQGYNSTGTTVSVRMPSLQKWNIKGKECLVIYPPAITPLDTNPFYTIPESGNWSRLELTPYAEPECFAVATPTGTIMSPKYIYSATISTNTVPISFLSPTKTFYHAGTNDRYKEFAASSGVWKTPTLDFGNQNMKHFYSVEVVGTFPEATVDLWVTEDDLYPSESTFGLGAATLQQTRIDYNHTSPIIFRNIGRYRRPRITIVVTSTQDWRLDGIMVKYNMGTR